MSKDWIEIRGAREHNLKNISVRIPRDKLTVMTGISGSGKSSLAFDTLYAEGQRRYVESLSAYARQFLGEMSKPDVDSIEGLSPAISIDQKSAGKNPRSTVGTITEIYDYLRVLYARVGHPHCPNCGIPIERQTAQQIIEQALTIPEGSRFLVLAPMVRGRKGEYRQLLDDVRRQGYVRVRVDGEVYELEDVPELDKDRRHTIEVVIDRLVMREGIRRRLADSVETALGLSGGTVTLSTAEDGDHTFSEQFSCPQCGFSFQEISPRMFSFNSPYGACESCGGLGTKQEVDPQTVVADPNQPVWDGALNNLAEREIPWRRLAQLASQEGFSLSTPWRELTEEQQQLVLYGRPGGRYVRYRNRSGDRRTYYTDYEGPIPALERRHRETDSEWTRQKIEDLMTARTCYTCGGARLKAESLAVTVGGLSIAEFCRQSAEAALRFMEALSLSEREATIAGRLVKEIGERLRFMIDVGLDYLTVDRAAATLSGGEAQRIRLATQIGSSLMGVLYILDEPSIGLHPRDNGRLIATLRRLRDLGNTVVVVEHDEETILSADFVVDLGPGAGENGGEVVAAGPLQEILEVPGSITARFLRGEESIPLPIRRRRSQKGKLTVRGARQHNLKTIDVAIPLGLFVCITGVSGSGKSTLIRDILYPALLRRLYRSRLQAGAHRGLEGVELIDKVIDVDQSPIGRTPRSNPATYTGLFDDIRSVFSETPEAKMRGYRPGRFSFNVKGGRCEACRGDGTIKIEMHFLPDVYVSCEVCKGKRYNAETLEVHFKGRNIADVLAMSVDEALEFFINIPRIRRKLETLADVGLGYVRLGQPATTLSGGEAQRVKLSTELSRTGTGRTLYLLDEPTTGLHFADIRKLLSVLDRLVEAGNTVVVIEHNLDVVKTADWIIDLGPEGGEAGGYVVAEGSPEEIAGNRDSYTGHYLARILGTAAPAVSTAAAAPARKPGRRKVGA